MIEAIHIINRWLAQHNLCWLMSDMTTITGLWESRDRHGNKMLSGTQGSATYFVFENPDRTGNQPTHFLKICSSRQAKELKENDEIQRGTGPQTDGPF